MSCVVCDSKNMHFKMSEHVFLFFLIIEVCLPLFLNVMSVVESAGTPTCMYDNFMTSPKFLIEMHLKFFI